MDINMITDLVGNLGFPIAVCVAMFWYCNKISEKHIEESRGFVEAINNNNKLIQRVIDMMQGDHS